MSDGLGTTSPPAFFLLVWCPECQHNDRYVSLRERLPHKTPAGRNCSGTPIRVRYEPVIPNPLRESKVLERPLISPTDLKIEPWRIPSGVGGQQVVKTHSGVRITHLPTGIVIEVESERSQLRNKELAMDQLLAQLTLLEPTADGGNHV